MFAAELHGLADTVEAAKLIAMACTEIALGALQPKTLTQVEETGTLELPLDAIIDAKSVFEAI